MGIIITVLTIVVVAIVTTFVTSNIVLSLIYGLPRATFEILAGRLQVRGVLPFIVAPLTWGTIVGLLWLTVEFIWPGSSQSLMESSGFAFGFGLGFFGTLLSAISSQETRANMCRDYESATERFRN